MTKNIRMKELFYSTILLLFIHTIGHTQKPHPCGTAPIKTPWLKKYQKDPQAFRGAKDSLLLVPMTIHSLGSDNGGSHFSTQRILDAFCTLNEDFEPAGIKFFIKDDIRIINNSAINSHTDYYLGGRYMNEMADTNSINTFIVSNPAGNCGYNILWSHMMLGKNCAGPEDHTWAHEVGHHFQLPHPFFGWENGQTWDNSTPPDFTSPAPEFVTANYTQFFYEWAEDTIIVDTALVEKVDRSNCHEAADGFCDTQPDYIANRWNCNTDSLSSTTQTDPNGEKFQSDGSLIMSYSNDRCANRFSDEQIATMRAFLLEQKQAVFRTPVTPLADVDEPIEMIFPGNAEAVPFNSVEFQWEPVANATDYLLQVSRLPTFPQYNVNERLTSNTFVTNDLDVDKTYYWRVRAFNNFSTCLPWSPVQSFTTSEISAVAKIDNLNELIVYPSILKSGNSFSLKIESSESINGQVQILDTNGKLMLSQKLNHLTGTQTYNFATDNLRKGMYLVGLMTENGRVFRKLIVE